MRTRVLECEDYNVCTVIALATDSIAISHPCQAHHMLALVSGADGTRSGPAPTNMSVRAATSWAHVSASISVNTSRPSIVTA